MTLWVHSTMGKVRYGTYLLPYRTCPSPLGFLCHAPDCIGESSEVTVRYLPTCTVPTYLRYLSSACFFRPNPIFVPSASYFFCSQFPFVPSLSFCVNSLPAGTLAFVSFAIILAVLREDGLHQRSLVIRSFLCSNLASSPLPSPAPRSVAKRSLHPVHNIRRPYQPAKAPKHRIGSNTHFDSLYQSPTWYSALSKAI
jgi:hypothetical protein